MNATPRHPLWIHLAVWGLVPVVELAVAAGTLVPVGPLQLGLEAYALVSLGWVQWRFGRTPGQRSLLWPAWLPVLSLLLTARRPGGLEPLAVYAIGLSALTWLVGGRVARWRPHPVLAGALAVATTLGLRADALVRGADIGVVPSAPTALPPLGPAPNGPDLLLLSVDTLRVDAARDMAVYQRLAEDGLTWDRAMSTSSWTLPALGSLQTGLLPQDHGAVCLPGLDCQGLHADVPTLAEDLRGAGYATAAVQTNAWGCGNGLERGFGTHVPLGNATPQRLVLLGEPWGPAPITAERAVDAALRVAHRADRDRPLYLWVHLLDPHLPYLHSSHAGQLVLLDFFVRGDYFPDEAARDELREGYAHEVAVADAELTRLLDRWPRDRDRVVVLTADHGEEFWEHGAFGHGHSHHAEVVEVPLVLAGAGVPAGARSDTVSLRDVPATLRALAGLDPRGHDLRQVAEPTRTAAAQGTFFGPPTYSARDADTRVIAVHHPDGDVVLAWDQRNDPGELHPFAPPAADPVLERALSIEDPARGDAADLDMQALKALGYVH